jgi:hypothetical protein
MSAPSGRKMFLLSRRLRHEARKGRQTDRQTDNENSQDPEDGCVLGCFISRLCSTIDLFRRSVRCNCSTFWACDTAFRSIATACHSYIHYCVGRYSLLTDSGHGVCLFLCLVAGFIHPLPFLHMITSFLPAIVPYFARMFSCQFFQNETEGTFAVTLLQFSEFRINFMIYIININN